MYKLSFATIAQSIAEQDIELKEFGSKEKLLYYFEKRSDFGSFNGVYVVVVDIDDGIYNNNQYPAALISRSFNQVHNYIRDFWIMNTDLHFFVFEYETYSDAVGYVSDIFETSSINGL